MLFSLERCASQTVCGPWFKRVFAEQPDGGFIGQMAVIAENTRFEVAGIRAAVQPMHVMVRFQHQQMRPADRPPHGVGDMAEIGQMTDFLAARAMDDIDAYRVGGIMRHGKRFDVQIADLP